MAASSLATALVAACAADFGKDSVTLEVHNPAYAALMAQVNATPVLS